MQQTSNYALPQWEQSDAIKRADFNDAMSAIDTALKANADAAGAARSTAQSAAAGIGTHGKNCRVATGSYTGTGTHGSANPTVFSTGFYPVLVAVIHPSGGIRHTYFLTRPANPAPGPNGGQISVSWGSDRVSCWSPDGGAYAQFNGQTEKYDYVAFGYDL